MSRTYGLFSVHHESLDRCFQLIEEDLELFERLQKEGSSVSHYVKALEKIVKPHLEAVKKEKNKSLELLLEYKDGSLNSYVPNLVDSPQNARLFDNYVIASLPKEQVLRMVRTDEVRKEIEAGCFY